MTRVFDAQCSCLVGKAKLENNVKINNFLFLTQVGILICQFFMHVFSKDVQGMPLGVNTCEWCKPYGFFPSLRGSKTVKTKQVNVFIQRYNVFVV